KDALATKDALLGNALAEAAEERARAESSLAARYEEEKAALEREHRDAIAAVQKECGELEAGLASARRGLAEVREAHKTAEEGAQATAQELQSARAELEAARSAADGFRA